MPKVNDDRLIDTVNNMEDEWLSIVERTGDLTLEDMRRSLKQRYDRGDRSVVYAVTESTLMRMNHFLISELVM